MYTFITNPDPSNGGRIMYPQMDYIRKRLHENASKLRSHYLSAGYNVASQHPLVGIIGSMNVPLTMEPNRYRDHISDLSASIGRNFGITSAIQNSPLRHHGWIYGGNVKESYILLEREFSDVDLRLNWRNLQPVRVLRHTKTDLDLTIYTGKPTSNETGFASLEIDIPMLLCQYRMWRLEENRKSPELQESTMQFVFKYPLVNLTQTHADVAFLNRVIATVNGEAYTKSIQRNSIALATPETFTDPVINQLVRTLLSAPLRFTDILKSIPLPFSGNAYEFFKFPRYPNTRQIRWAMFLAIIPIIGLLVRCSYATSNGSNKTWINEILIDIKRMKNDRILEGGLSGGDLALAQYEIETKIIPYI